MRALSLTQPWATLVAIGAKRVETRSRYVSYRGPLAIHASAGFASIGGRRRLLALLQQEPFWRVLAAAYRAKERREPTLDELAAWLPLGAVVATCRVLGCNPTQRVVDDHLFLDERAFGDYSPGRFAILLTDVRPLRVPIPARGALGLWRLPPDLVVEVGHDAPRV